MRKLLWITTIALSLSAACSYTEGECWLRSEDSGQDGSGGGPLLPGGPGGYGDVPPEPQDVNDSAPPECNSVGGFSASLFKFATTIADDGTDVAGGYQEATVNVKFVDGRQDPPTSWSCSVWVGMPLRSAAYGKISPSYAAEIAADVLTSAASATMHSRASWIQALFCSQLAENMRGIFKNQYKGLGGSARAQ